MSKGFSLIIAVVMVITLGVGCSQDDDESDGSTTEQSYPVFCGMLANVVVPQLAKEDLTFERLVKDDGLNGVGVGIAAAMELVEPSPVPPDYEPAVQYLRDKRESPEHTPTEEAIASAKRLDDDLSEGLCTAA